MMMITMTMNQNDDKRTVGIFAALGNPSLEKMTCSDTFAPPLRKYAEWQAIRRFQSLDDSSLQDIGIERYEIRDFVANTH